MSSLAIIKDERYLDHDAGAGHPESPGRLRVIHDLIGAEFPDLPLIRPRPATPDELALVHDPFYVRSVEQTAGSYVQLDPDTGTSPRSYETACLAAGALLAAVDALLAPGARPPASIFAFVRPPGHHAEAGRAMGFCLFNNVAVAAAYAKKRYGLRRVLIVDWDLHHGNGTQHAFYEDPSVLFFSSHQYPYYPGSGGYDQAGSGAGTGFTVNAPFPAGFGDNEYLRVYREILLPVALEYAPELVLVSAGFDPFIRDPLGGMNVTGPGFGGLAALVREISEATRSRIVITLEGGYNPEGLRDGVRAVLQALQGTGMRTAAAPDPAADTVIGNIRSVHRQYWKSLR